MSTSAPTTVPKVPASSHLTTPTTLATPLLNSMVMTGKVDLSRYAKIVSLVPDLASVVAVVVAFQVVVVSLQGVVSVEVVVVSEVGSGVVEAMVDMEAVWVVEEDLVVVVLVPMLALRLLRRILLPTLLLLVARGVK